MENMLFLLMVLTAFVGQAQPKSKSVSVSLETKWSSTPLLLETSEFLASEGNSQFWKFVDTIASEDPASLIDASDEDLYRLSLRHAEPLLSPMHMKLLKFALSLRYYSPAIAMYAQAAAEKKTSCEAFVEVNNMVTCDMDAMAAYIKVAAGQPQPSVIGLDHHYPGSKDSPVVVILYAEIGTGAFSQWHTVLQEKAKHGDIDYILRHYVHEPPKKGVVLSGYGVELAIKSTEYKAKDDTKVEENKNKDSKKDDDDEEVEGFIFSTLKKQHPELTQNLTEFQQHLIKGLGELAPLKVWQLQGKFSRGRHGLKENVH
ncbi:UDP-glucose:glycoprotein glucosyltransferase 2 [Lamellibrachia satsuma]|nr:UDP-glucose:glycoprotein glucosyltransferase 2 [Lamellibrachia satsuma]